MQFAQQLWGPASASNISIVAFPPFEVPSFAVRVNALWFGSLICSLVTASLAILMKQWFREYLSWDCAATEERIRVRYVRYSGLTRWRIFDIAAALPLLLQASLILFFIGLVEWLRVADNAVWLSAMSLVACWLSLYLLAIVASIFSSRCPYKTPFLDPWVQRSRGFLTRWRYGEDWHKKMGHDNSYYEFPGDEKGIRRDSKLDIPALVSADRTLGSNHVLAECMQSCLRRVDGETVILITRKLFEHRLGYPIALLSDIRGFERIPSDALDALLRILINAVERELPSSTISWSSWISEALSCICSIVAHVQSPPKRNVNTSGASKLLTSLLSLNIDIVEGLFTTLLQTRPKIMWQLRNPSRSDDPGAFHYFGNVRLLTMTY